MIDSSTPASSAGVRRLPCGETQKIAEVGGLGNGVVVIDAMPSAVDARLAAVEQSVAALAHFIGADLRPDLGAGALSREADVAAQSDPSKPNKDAKDAKEMKEQENLGGGF